MWVRTNEEAESIVESVELTYVQALFVALRKIGCTDVEIEAHRFILANSANMSEAEIDDLHELRGGELLAGCIRTIEASRQLSRPIPARGWRQLARWILTVSMAVAGAALMSYTSSSVGELFGGAAGVACAWIFNRFCLGGRPELRHAVSFLLRPDVQLALQSVQGTVRRNNVDESSHSKTPPLGTRSLHFHQVR